MNEPCKVIITDDHPLMAHATRQLLEQMDTLEVVGVAHNGSSCLELMEEHQPGMVFLDYQLPDMAGTDIAEKIKKGWPDVHVVIFTGVDVSTMIPKFLELQVSGVISKGTHHDTIKHIVACILDDHIVMPRSGVQRLLFPAAPTLVEIELTEDEAAIMTMIVKGYTLEQIADRIHMSKRSVDNYQRKIYDKLGVKGRAQAIEIFVRSKYYAETLQEEADE
jgi:two-component system, NarL family, competent response regulator ComA